MKSYRTGFVLALVGNLVLAVILAGIWWHVTSTKKTSQAPPAPGSTAAPEPSAAPAASGAPSEPNRVPIELSPQRMQSIGVKTGSVERKNVVDEIRATGNVAVDETRLAYVQTRFSGFIQKVFADATYQYVRKGQPLFTIYSPDLVATEREYLSARQHQEQVAESTVAGVRSGAAALLTATTERLKQWGVPPHEIARLESSGQVQQELEVDSPASGYITERNALPSVAVQPEMRLYTIADLSVVWVQAQVFQNDIGRIHAGDNATLTVDTYPGRVWSGRVDFIYPQMDPETRTAKVRLVFSNPRLELKPGMFVNVSLKQPLGRQLVVPASAILHSGTRQIAFVSRGDGYFEPRDVQVGLRAGDDLIVLKGLEEGETIVTSANFLIDSESELQAALGAFAPPPPGAGAASAVNLPHANVELTTEPDPPQKGALTVRVKLTDANGASISGADVTVTFFMPAMPAMGMAAMRTQINLVEEGSGTYEGSGRLDSGGTWQVTILARKNGQTVGSKQLSVTAAGGM
jgi:RND family efflux transporter MFP subunit